MSSNSQPCARTEIPSPMPGRRTYVVDTSVLLSDPKAMLRFAEHLVVLPIVVITELEGKRHHPELGHLARAALRLLDDLRIRNGGLDHTIPLNDDGGHLWVELNHSEPYGLPDGFRLGDNDTRILSVAANYRDDGHDVVLVSKDLPLRVKASAIGLAAEEYRHELATEGTWTGMATLNVSDEAISWLYERTTVDLDEAHDLPVNTGLVLEGPTSSALGRRTADGSVKLVRPDAQAFGIHGRSAEQRIALDLLLDESVGIVSLGGRAGTGKSALALAAGLELALEQERYKKVIVFRPIYAVGGQDLGYLPGHPVVTDEQLRHRRGRPAWTARGATPHPHSRPLPARCLRHRRRGPVPGTQCAAHRALPHRPELPRGAHPRRRPARQPASGALRRGCGGR